MRWRWTLLGLLLLSAAGVAYLALGDDAPGEVLELVGEGGEKLLRDPMRPASRGSRVLVFALDGVGDHDLRAALRAGRMPELASVLGPATPREDGYAHGYAVPGVLSVLPSTTVAAWSSLFTGLPAGRTGVPGNEWFAREETRFYAPAPVSVAGHADAARVYTDQLMSALVRAPTLYERAGVRSYVSLHGVHRGADLLVVPEPAAYAELLGEWAGGLVGEGKAEQEAYEALDLAAVRSLLASVRKHGPATLQVVYFPGVDLFTHVASAPLTEQRGYLGTVVDPAIGRVLRAYREAGVLDSTWVVVVADHGHTPVLADDRHALEAEGEDEPPEVLRRAGFRVRPPTLEPAEADYQAVVAYQGAMAYVYLADRSTCARPGERCDWRRPPRLADDVLPVVRAFDRANRTGGGVPALRGTLELILARPPRAPGEPALPFQVWDGARLVPIGRYLARHPRPELLDLERRLAGLATGPYGHRAGDVLLLARSGMERPIGERFYFSGRYRSWHGSPTAQDSRIPLLVAHPARTGAEIRERVRGAVGESPSQLDVSPLLLDLLGEGVGTGPPPSATGRASRSP